MIDKKYHILYKTVCIINTKYYIGKHSTNKIDDGYLGSGYVLRRAIKKYGREQFTRYTIAFYDTYEELNKAEADYITEEIIQDPLSYNISGGGIGGYLSLEIYKRRKIIVTDDMKRRISLANTGRPRPDAKKNLIENRPDGMDWSGKQRSIEDRQTKSRVAKANVHSGKNPFVHQAICPHCKKEGQLINLMRWHFDNCKLKDDNAA